jgi:uncharacterized glyoxalase superfamily protein PhnB
MAKQITKVEDVGTKKDQALFMAATAVFFNGDVEAAIKHYNEAQIRFEARSEKSHSIQDPPSESAYVGLRFKI